mgnify:CR=1 FL=1
MTLELISGKDTKNSAYKRQSFAMEQFYIRIFPVLKYLPKNERNN